MSDGRNHWGQGGVRRFREAEMDPGLAQSLAVRQVTTLTHLPTGAREEADAAVTFPPGSPGLAHTAGPDECLYLVVQGEILLRWGEDLGHSGIAGAGDMVLIPPWTPHTERNASDSVTLERLLVRTGN